MEEWRPIPGYEGHYDISNSGRVRCVKPRRERMMVIQTHSRDGHAMIGLSVNSMMKSFTIARLICMAWHGPAWGRRVEHINGLVTDDRPENVRWAGRL